MNESSIPVNPVSHKHCEFSTSQVPGCPNGQSNSQLSQSNELVITFTHKKVCSRFFLRVQPMFNFCKYCALGSCAEECCLFQLFSIPQRKGKRKRKRRQEQSGQLGRVQDCLHTSCGGSTGMVLREQVPTLLEFCCSVHNQVC